MEPLPSISANRTMFSSVRKESSIINFLIRVFLFLRGAVLSHLAATVYCVMHIVFCLIMIIFGFHCDGGRLRLEW